MVALWGLALLAELPSEMGNCVPSRLNNFCLLSARSFSPGADPHFFAATQTVKQQESDLL